MTQASGNDLAALTAEAFRALDEEFAADAWDRQIEAAARAGHLDDLVAQADADFEAGRCTPL